MEITAALTGLGEWDWAGAEATLSYAPLCAVRNPARVEL